MKTRVVEWAPFTVKPGVSEAALTEASRDLQETFLARQPGYLRRELVRDPAGSYVDLVWWTDVASASAAMARAADSAACQMYFALMDVNGDGAGAGVRHLHVVAEY